MYRILTFTALAITVTTLDTFVSALIPPLHLIAPIPIAVILMFLFKGLEKTYVPAYILGLLYGYIHFKLVIFTTILFLLATWLVSILRKTIITHESGISVFLLALAFHAIMGIGQSLAQYNISFLATQEMLFSIFLNALLTFITFFLISNIHQQFKKQFIYENQGT